jgi:peptidoglycan hydrolase-like protein with peptidoglycan-binding domain
VNPRRLIVLAVSVTILAACGGGDDDGAATQTDTGAADASSTPTGAENPAVPPVTVSGGKPLQPGSRGRQVRNLQRALAALGYNPGRPDGQYGEMTRRAVVSFQRQAGLTADGVVGVQTASAINQALEQGG